LILRRFIKIMRLILYSFLIAVMIFVACKTQSTETVNVKPENKGDEETVTAPDGKTLLEERCTQCHNLDKVYTKAYDAEEWEDVVDRMIEKGAVLNDEERETLLDYLILE